ncbi:hypothetical protein H310_01965 [Aphanomyces invadans]|uniref:Uncharacterized protein n=1 Tax=Aphanomyces invadans TaxID=157072 RepID=A0A024UNP6_9STRA|nr:hypothetical protein H310_01965 [Aphanomyces invadans]ETW07452.1 hypothetical protein H310_01965 [Aphanomyces invadans]|eukprot:XP_008863545.1 hypothetical protein H310_01965 [Aphanomyces invadans]
MDTAASLASTMPNITLDCRTRKKSNEARAGAPPTKENSLTAAAITPSPSTTLRCQRNGVTLVEWVRSFGRRSCRSVIPHAWKTPLVDGRVGCRRFLALIPSSSCRPSRRKARPQSTHRLTFSSRSPAQRDAASRSSSFVCHYNYKGAAWIKTSSSQRDGHLRGLFVAATFQGHLGLAHAALTRTVLSPFPHEVVAKQSLHRVLLVAFVLFPEGQTLDAVHGNVEEDVALVLVLC